MYKKENVRVRSIRVGSTFILETSHSFFIDGRGEDDFRESFGAGKGGAGRMKDGRQRVSGGFEKSVVAGPSLFRRVRNGGMEI